MAAKLAMYVLVSVGVTAVIVQGGLIKPLRKLFSERRLLLVGSLLIAFGFAGTAALGLTENGALPIAVLIAFNIFVAAGSGVFSPSQSVASLARIIGPSMAGLLLDAHRALPFALAAVLMVFAAALTTRIRESA